MHQNEIENNRLFTIKGVGPGPVGPPTPAALDCVQLTASLPLDFWASKPFYGAEDPGLNELIEESLD